MKLSNKESPSKRGQKTHRIIVRIIHHTRSNLFLIIVQIFTIVMANFYSYPPCRRSIHAVHVIGWRCPRIDAAGWHDGLVGTARSDVAHSTGCAGRGGSGCWSGGRHSAAAVERRGGIYC